MNAHIEKNIQSYSARFPTVKNLIVFPSWLPTKRLVASFDLDEKKHIVHFGQRGAKTYADGTTKIRQRSYKARASKIKNNAGEYTYKIPGTANSLSYFVLWI